MLNARRRHFLEVFLLNLSSDRLKVPSKFAKHLAGRASGSVSLTGPSGNTWHVNLNEHNGHLFLDDGWSAFVKDHYIQCGDSLVFRYDGNLDFCVQIFDQTSCEKEEAFYAKCSEDLSNINGKLEKKREREGESAFLEVFDEKKMRVSSVPVHLAGSREHEVEACSNKGQELEEMMIDGYMNGKRNLVEASKIPIILALPSFGSDIIIPTVIVQTRSISKLKKASARKKQIVSQTKTSISKFVEARAAHYFTSSFPYFVRVMKYSNINDRSTLKIPVSFSMAHLPNSKLKVTLHNLNGDCWMLSCVPTVKLHSRMHTFCGGWLAFVRANSINMEDVCIFELVDKFEMRVHILRLGLEALDSQTQKGGITIAKHVSQDKEVHPPKISEHTNDPSIYDNEETGKVSEMIPEPPQEAVCFSDASADAIALASPFNSAPSPISKICSMSTDQRLRCNKEGTESCQTSSRSQSDLHARCSTQLPVKPEYAKTALSFTSPFPSFMKVMMDSSVSGSFTLNVPHKFSAAQLPSYRTDIVLRNLRGDSWNVISCRYGHQTKFCGGWMAFVRQNGVKVGDTCIFELVDEKVFQVHIFQVGRVQECPSTDATDDVSTTSFDSRKCPLLPETLIVGSSSYL